MPFVYVKVPLHKGVADRLQALHEEVDVALSAQSVGTLIGWGSSLSASPHRRSSTATHHRMDIEVIDQAKGLSVLQEALVGLACPDGTEIHYTEDGSEDGRAMQVVYNGAAWAGPTRRAKGAPR